MDVQSLIEWFKALAPAIAVAALFWKTGHGFLRLRRRRWIEEFKLSRAVLRSGVEHVHPFALESWYASVSGGVRLSYSKIRCALETGAPSEVLDRLRKGDEYLTAKASESGSLVLVGTEPDAKLKRRFWWFAGFYGTSAVVAGFPIFMRPFLPDLDPVGVIAYATLVSFPGTWIALLCLREGRKIRAARELVRDFPSLAAPVTAWTPAPAAPAKSTRKAHKPPKAAQENDAQSPS
jgi:hypothetical protein